MNKLYLGFLVALFAFWSHQAKASDVVILLHGITQSPNSMKPMEYALKKKGYITYNLSYKSTKQTIHTSAVEISKQITTQNIWDHATQVHFVTHSMGGLVVREYLNTYKDQIPRNKLGRVVMLAPPNGGSEIADFMNGFFPYTAFYGPAGYELTTEYQVSKKYIPYYDLGIITGSKGWPYVFANFMLEGENDWRVRIESAKMKGMKDHVTLPATHAFISWKPSVQKQVIHFLKNGKFSQAHISSHKINPYNYNK